MELSTTIINNYYKREGGKGSEALGVFRGFRRSEGGGASAVETCNICLFKITFCLYNNYLTLYNVNTVIGA